MNRLLSLSFLLMLALSVACFIWGPAVNIWLPRDVSSHGHKIDHLYYFILWLTGIVFVATEWLLFYFIWTYQEGKQDGPVKYTHGNHTLEVVWTIIPAAMLLFIAIYQMNPWTEDKINTPKMSPTVEVQARQFQWLLRYPGPDGIIGTADDLWTDTDLHVPVGEQILVTLKAQDVLHSFFLPELRVKQDAVPGMAIPVWFQANEIGKYDLPCAELCGWGHYKMRGQLTVESRADFEAWLVRLQQEQNKDQESASSQVAANP